MTVVASVAALVAAPCAGQFAEVDHRRLEVIESAVRRLDDLGFKRITDDDLTLLDEATSLDPRRARSAEPAWQNAETWRVLAAAVTSPVLSRDAERLAEFSTEFEAYFESGLESGKALELVWEGDWLATERIDEFISFRSLVEGLRQAEQLTLADQVLLEAYDADRGNRELALANLFQFLFQVQRVDEADFARRSLISGDFFARMAALDDFVVSIQSAILRADGRTTYAHVGTGFWYRGHVITCAHVVIEAAKIEDKPLDWSRIRVVPAGPEGQFDAATGGSVGVVPPNAVGGSFALYHWDTACLKLEPGSALDQEAISALRHRYGTNAGSCVAYGRAFDEIEIGVVHGLSAYGTNRSPFARRVWIQPGRILFPARAKGPRGARVRLAGSGFRRALRTELLGRLPEVIAAEGTLEKLVADVVRDLTNPMGVLPSYAPCDTQHSCRFRYPVEADAGLEDHSANQAFKDDPRIECFGSDLATQPSTSGSPILLLADETPVVVGVHTGRHEIATTRLVPASLKQMERAVPFYRVRKEIDRRLDADGDP